MTAAYEQLLNLGNSEVEKTTGEDRSIENPGRRGDASDGRLGGK
jgi:hypothetical protein